MYVFLFLMNFLNLSIFVLGGLAFYKRNTREPSPEIHNL